MRIRPSPSALTAMHSNSVTGNLQPVSEGCSRHRPKKKICIFRVDCLVDDSESERCQNTTAATTQEANTGAAEPHTRGQPGQSGIVPGLRSSCSYDVMVVVWTTFVSIYLGNLVTVQTCQRSVHRIFQ